MDADTARFYSRDGLLSQIYDQLTAAEWEASQNDEGTQKSVSPPKDLIHPLSGNHVLVETLERENDPLTQTFKERWRFTETDSRGALVLQKEAQLQMRWTFRYEMRHLVESCGFVVESEYSDFRRSAPQYGKEQIWVLRHRTEA